MAFSCIINDKSSDAVNPVCNRTASKNLIFVILSSLILAITIIIDFCSIFFNHQSGLKGLYKKSEITAQGKIINSGTKNQLS